MYLAFSVGTVFQVSQKVNDGKQSLLAVQLRSVEEMTAFLLDCHAGTVTITEGMEIW